MFFHIYNLSYYTKFLAQALSIGVLKILLFRPNINNHEPLRIEKNKHYMVVANHHHALDPFYITCSFRWRELIHLLPFAIMTANKFMDPWWIRLPAWLGGCFPSHGPKPIHGVTGAIKFLKAGYTVLMFPEGKRTSAGKKGVAKPGISHIINASPEAHIILAHIEWQKPPRFASVSFAHTVITKNNPSEILESIYKL